MEEQLLALKMNGALIMAVMVIAFPMDISNATQLAACLTVQRILINAAQALIHVVQKNISAHMNHGPELAVVTRLAIQICQFQ
jgi:hypothetical protein